MMMVGLAMHLRGGALSRLALPEPHCHEGAVQHSALSLLQGNLKMAVAVYQLREIAAVVIPLQMGLLLKEIQAVAAKGHIDSFGPEGLHALAARHSGAQHFLFGAIGKAKLLPLIDRSREVKRPCIAFGQRHHADRLALPLHHQGEFTDIGNEIFVPFHAKIFLVHLQGGPAVNLLHAALPHGLPLSQCHRKLPAHRLPAQDVVHVDVQALPSVDGHYKAGGKQRPAYGIDLTFPCLSPQGLGDSIGHGAKDGHFLPALSHTIHEPSDCQGGIHSKKLQPPNMLLPP